jgi:hypothetical protein
MDDAAKQKWFDLAKACIDSINRTARIGTGRAFVAVSLKGALPRKGWPRPRDVREIGPRERVCWYDAFNFLAAICAHGLVDYEFKQANGIRQTPGGTSEKGR